MEGLLVSVSAQRWAWVVPESEDPQLVWREERGVEG